MPRGRHRIYRDEQEGLLATEASESSIQLRNRGNHEEAAIVGFVQRQGSSFHNNNNNNNNPFASTFARYDFISHEVQCGDTLAGIALRYDCKLALLKQANNLSSEAHLAALPYIKVPVPRNGVQTGRLIDISAKVEIQREGPGKEELCPQRFMENLDEKLRELQKQAPPPSTPPLLKPRADKPRTFFTSSCLLITCLVGVCIGLPIMYTVYILTNPFHGDVFKFIPS